MAPRSERGRAETTAGAWAAAAVVLALGSLVFAVFTQFENQDLKDRVERLERGSAASPSTSLPEIVDDGSNFAAPTTGSGESAPPADRAAVKQAFVTLYDGSKPVQERIANVDDSSGVLEAFEAASGGALAGVMASLRAEVSAITFTTNMTATVSYSLSSSAGPPTPRTGSAKLVDGAWKVTRSTVCADLADAGVPCT